MCGRDIKNNRILAKTSMILTNYVHPGESRANGFSILPSLDANHSCVHENHQSYPATLPNHVLFCLKQICSVQRNIYFRSSLAHHVPEAAAKAHKAAAANLYLLPERV
jgi:hypothetical protein